MLKRFFYLQEKELYLCLKARSHRYAGHDKDRTVSSCLAGGVNWASDMELGHWVTGSMGHLGHLSRPGHRVIILTRCETRVFPFFDKMPKMQNVHVKC